MSNFKVFLLFKLILKVTTVVVEVVAAEAEAMVDNKAIMVRNIHSHDLE